MAAIETNGNADVPVSPQAALPDRGVSYKLFAVIGFVLFACSFAISYVYRHLDVDTPPDGEKAPRIAQARQPKDLESPQALAAATTAELKRAHGLFEQTRWDEALAVYAQIQEGKLDRTDLVNLRIAACLEELGRWNDALAAYRWTASHGQKRLRDVACLGQARVFIRLGQPTPAKSLLCAFLLQTSSADADLTADGRYLLGFALSNEVLPRTAVQPLKPTSVRPTLCPQPGVSIADGQQIAATAAKGEVGTLSAVAEVRDAETDESHTEAVTATRIAAARRILNDAVRAYPSQAWAATAYLELGCLEEAQGNLAQAQSLYERVIREWPRSPLVIAANYNLGITFERQGKPAQAIHAFYKVFDQSPGHELAAPALVHIGCIHLNQGEFREALVPLRRAVTVAAGSDSQPATAIALAAAYLAAGKPRDASTLLLQYRDALADPRCRATAAFLDAYGLYLSAVARKETRKEGVGLVNALLGVRNEMFLDDFGKYLVGKAFRDLGMWNEVVKSYDKLAQASANPLLREITLYLAEAHYMLKTPKRAESLLTSLTERHKDSWAVAARLQLAAIAFQEDRPRECLQNCTLILQEHLPVENDAMLHLMGQAYERLGEHDKAARCFAGTAP